MFLTLNQFVIFRLSGGRRTSATERLTGISRASPPAVTVSAPSYAPGAASGRTRRERYSASFRFPAVKPSPVSGIAASNTSNGASRVEYSFAVSQSAVKPCAPVLCSTRTGRRRNNSAENAPPEDVKRAVTLVPAGTESSTHRPALPPRTVRSGFNRRSVSSSSG